MSRTRRLRQQNRRTAKSAASEHAAIITAQPQVRWAALWLSAAFLLPNLGALACGFVFDDLSIIRDNESLHPHSWRQLLHIWAMGYSPNPHILGLYRPVSQTLWALLWVLGRGHAWMFHAAGLALGLAVVLLFYEFLLTVQTGPRIAFVAALLFALFPIHTEATTSIVGSAEMLAAGFALAALLIFYRLVLAEAPASSDGQAKSIMPPRAALQKCGWLLVSIALFALAVFAKESAAAFAALPLAFPPGNGRSQWRRQWYIAAGAGATLMIATALVVHHHFARSDFIPPIDNPTALLDWPPRILTALWVQVLYVFKTVVPITLSGDYSYKEIPLVMGLDDWRAWAGLALAATAGALAVGWKITPRRKYCGAVLAWCILFSATANLIFPIGTIMGERLAYAPTLGLALLLAIVVVEKMGGRWKTVALAVALIFGVRTAFRNLDWLNADHFYTKMAQTSPNSAKAWYSLGALRSARGDDVGAIAAYDRAIEIFPAYSEAYHNRGNSLARLGRREEAMASYRQCLRFDPGHSGARSNLIQLQAGLSITPPRKKL